MQAQWQPNWIARGLVLATAGLLAFATAAAQTAPAQTAAADPAAAPAAAAPLQQAQTQTPTQTQSQGTQTSSGNPPLAVPTGTGNDDPFGGQWEISIGGAALFAKASNPNDVALATTNVGGLVGGIRYHLDDHDAFEIRYGFAVPTQTYGGAFIEQFDANELSFDYAWTLPTDSRLRPYALGGGGIIRSTPTGNSNNTPGASALSRPALIYGGGIDVKLRGPFSVWLEYRGFFYRIPDFHFITINQWNHLAEPDVSLVYHF